MTLSPKQDEVKQVICAVPDCNNLTEESSLTDMCPTCFLWYW